MRDPGWYPDPLDEAVQRYWDGVRWTEHVVVPVGGRPSGATQSRPWAAWLMLAGGTGTVVASTSLATWTTVQQFDARPGDVAAVNTGSTVLPLGVILAVAGLLAMSERGARWRWIDWLALASSLLILAFVILTFWVANYDIGTDPEGTETLTYGWGILLAVVAGVLGLVGALGRLFR